MSARRAKTHGLNRVFRPEQPDPDWSICGLAAWQIVAHANHAGEFGIDCKRCLSMLRWLGAPSRGGDNEGEGGTR